MSSADLVARFQPYTLSIFDPRSLGGFSTRQLITFPTRRRKSRFIRFLRRKCHARRRGNWACIQGHSMFTKAIDYASRHGSYVYTLSVKKAPAHRRLTGANCDSDCEESADENVAEEDLLSDAEDL